MLESLQHAVASMRRAAGEVSGLASDLELASEAGPRLNDAPSLQARVELIQSFALASLGTARAEAAAARSSAYGSERAALRAVRRIAVSNAWLDTYAAQRTLATARAESILAQELVGRTARALALGEATTADLADTEAYTAEAQLAVLAAEGEWTEARLRLTATLGADSQVAWDAAGEPPELRPPSAAQARSLSAALERLPGPVAAEQRRLTLIARARELDAQHASTLRLGLAVDHPDPDTWTPLAMVGVTLPWRGRAARERAELQADEQLVAAEWSQAVGEARIQVQRALHEIEHTARVLQQLDTQLLPAIERGVETRTRLLAEGEIATHELIVARRSLLAQRVRRERARVQWLSALASFHELRAAADQGRQP
ncbi:MAG TPA: TolC family protein [Polyangiales bacterium]|nr:TolC family protein [Polyangiales bacterium]